MTHFNNARSAARLAANGRDTHFQAADRLGTADAWHFITAGHGYIAAHVPGLTARLADVLRENEWLYVDLDNEIVAGEEDCAAAVVLWVAKMRGAELPEYIEAPKLAESVERWFPGTLDKIGAALA